jgi:hypothetical protein
MFQPSLGQKVRVWPAVGVRVQDGADRFGQFLSPDGREVVWDVYWARRLLDGSVHLHDPRPAAAPPSTRND